MDVHIKNWHHLGLQYIGQTTSYAVGLYLLFRLYIYHHGLYTFDLFHAKKKNSREFLDRKGNLILVVPHFAEKKSVLWIWYDLVCSHDFQCC